MNRVLSLCVLLLLPVAPAAAQISGSVSTAGLMFPVTDPDGRGTVSEWRSRVQAEAKTTLGSSVRLVAGGYADSLVSDRREPSGRHISAFGHVRPLDVYAEARTRIVEVRVGMSRMVWGRLDEFQPTDVVNPLDLSRFILEGRSEARLSVPMLRTRWFLPASSTLEVVVTPAFRAGTFDELREATSPFNLGPHGVPIVRATPSSDWSPKRVPGGARFSTTTGRIDWSLTTFRGHRSFPVYQVNGVVPGVTATYPEFTMVGGDFETARGPWGVRGEVAGFVKDGLQSDVLGRGVSGHTWQGGLGVDRKTGAYRVAGDVIISTTRVDGGNPTAAAAARIDPNLERNSVTLVASADRSFTRDTRNVKLFAAYDPGNKTTFARFIGAVSLGDNVWFETSAGLFLGRSAEPLGRLTNEDFVYARLKVFF